MPTLIGYKTCHHFHRIAVFLCAKRVHFEMRFIENEAYLLHTDNSNLPILVTESGNPISDPMAILEYLDEHYELVEDDLSTEERAYVRMWFNKGVIASERLNHVFLSKSEFEFFDKLKFVYLILDQAEKATKSDPYFQGMFLSNIDFSWIPFFLRTNVINEFSGIDILKRYQNLRLLRKELIDNSYTERPTKEDISNAYIELCISQNTYLRKYSIKPKNDTNLIMLIDK